MAASGWGTNVDGCGPSAEVRHEVGMAHPVILYLVLAAAVLFGAASVTGLALVGSSSSALGDRVALVTQAHTKTGRSRGRTRDH
jgi:hypothetical protein